MNVYKPCGWDTMTPEEKSDHHMNLGGHLLYHRKRYYFKDDPEVSDFEYDGMEKNYEYVCSLGGFESIIKDMVGYKESEETEALIANRRYL